MDRSCSWVNGRFRHRMPPVNLALYVRTARRPATAQMGRCQYVRSHAAATVASRNQAALSDFGHTLFGRGLVVFPHPSWLAGTTPCRSPRFAISASSSGRSPNRGHPCANPGRRRRAAGGLPARFNSPPPVLTHHAPPLSQRSTLRKPPSTPVAELHKTVDWGGGHPELGASLGLMPRPPGKITLARSPSSPCPGGQQEHITGFKTEASALDWDR